MRLTRSTVSALLRDHDIAPSKALGQNFLVDPNTADRIVRLAGIEPGDTVVEVGPGVGSLTVSLLDAGASVRAVELDHRLAVVVAEVTEGRCEVVQGDALDVDLAVLCQGERVRVVANLPYNVAVPIVVRFLEEAPNVATQFVMVQAEVADRLVAAPGSRAYGAVSVKVAYYATASVAGRIPRTVFLPEPAVDSAVLSIERRSAVAVDPGHVGPERLFSVVRTAFGQRRKMLRRSLEGLVDPEAFDRAGIAPTRRPEELSVEDFGRLAAVP